MKATNRQKRGANAVEFALLLPVLVLFLAGVMDYGWYFHQQALVSSATRHAARTGAAASEAVTPESEASAALQDTLADYGFTGTVYADIYLEDVAPYQVLVVDVETPYGPLLGLVPAPLSHRAVTAMRVEVQR